MKFTTKLRKPSSNTRHPSPLSLSLSLLRLHNLLLLLQPARPPHPLSGTASSSSSLRHSLLLLLPLGTALAAQPPPPPSGHCGRHSLVVLLLLPQVTKAGIASSSSFFPARCGLLPYEALTTTSYSRRRRGKSRQPSVRPPRLRLFKLGADCQSWLYTSTQGAPVLIYWNWSIGYCSYCNSAVEINDFLLWKQRKELMDVKDSIVDIPVQDPPHEEFSAADLTWTKFGTNEHVVDDVALIPNSRVDAFINGECSNVECPTRFHIERGRKRPKGSLKEYKSDEYLLYRLYWCSFGPENYGEGGTILPSRRYRLNTRNRAARPQSMRGCTCHFAVKRLYARPSIAMIIYHERRHINKSGFICHGPLDKDAIGPGAKKVPYIGNDVQQQTMSLIYLGIPAENVLQTHIEGVQRYCGPTSGHNASQYVQKLEMIIKRSSHELDLDDQASIRLWAEKNKKSVFFYQDSSETDPFILGIQTEWQLQQMIRFGHQSLLAVDSSFGISKLKYPLYTLLAFDSRLHALPVAWVITRTIAKEDVSKWLKALIDRIRGVDVAWKISSFIFDDPTTDVGPIRDIFCCPVLFCLWRIRRSWLRNVIKRCINTEVQREMFKRLGKILYSIWNSADFTQDIAEFVQDFVDQTAFVRYFKDCWVPKIEMWLQTLKSFPLAGLETCGAIEAYHVKLKLKVYDDSQLGSLQRVDWLVHKLTTEIHSSYWLDLYADESGSFETVKEDYISSTSWHRAMQIPDDTVSFDDKDHLFAIVVSQNESSQLHMVWNPGSEFAFCDCSWSMQANLCKHIIKVNTLCHNNRDYAPSMSYQSFREVIQNLWRKPTDDSISLDQSMAWTTQMHDKIQRLVELNSSSDIGVVVKELPIKWNCKKGRTLVGKPPCQILAICKKGRTSAGKPASNVLALPSTNSNSQKRGVAMKRNRKRKRLSRLT